MLRVQQNLNSSTEPNFGRIYGGESAIDSLIHKYYFDFAKQLDEILPEAQKASEGVDIFFKDTDQGFDIIVGEEMKEGHPLFEFFSNNYKTPKKQNDYMLSRFSDPANKNIRAFGPLYYNSLPSNEFGKKVLQYVVEYKKTFLEWIAEKK